MVEEFILVSISSVIKDLELEIWKRKITIGIIEM